MATLLDRYKTEIQPVLRTELGIKNRLAVPRLTKVVVSMGTGSPADDKNRCEAAAGDLARITGQKAQLRRARQSVSNFKLREGMVVFDAVYNPIETTLLRQAREAGCVATAGFEWFVAQAAAQFETWTGLAAPRERMAQVVRERLSQK